MTARAVLVLVVSAGCAGDPSVSVRFEVPAPYRDLVDAVSLEVLASEELDCDAVALGNASAEEQATARVAEALVRQPGDEAPLSGIPRTGSKLFVARALSASDQLIAAGCAGAGTIDGDLEVVIEGEPALTLGARDIPGSGPLPEQVTILVSNARGSPVAGVSALQTVYAAADTAIPGDPATTGLGGALRFEVAQPAWAGPQASTSTSGGRPTSAIKSPASRRPSCASPPRSRGAPRRPAVSAGSKTPFRRRST